MTRGAKELCAILITKQLQELNEEETDIVVDYLEDIGIEVDIDMDDKFLCRSLLEKAMQDELGRPVPISAYANKIIAVSGEKEKEKAHERQRREIERKRKSTQKLLEKKDQKLPGCVTGNIGIPKGLLNFVVDPDLGIQRDSEGNMIYTAVASVSPEIYQQIFLSVSNPVLELVTSKGNRGYARLGEPIPMESNQVYITPLVSRLLKLDEEPGKSGFVRLCVAMPTIYKIDFTFYGNKTDLDTNIEYLINKLPDTINAFSSLSLGMELIVIKADGETLIVRIDGLSGEDGKPIFSGLIPVGLTDIPFEITPDI